MTLPWGPPPQPPPEPTPEEIALARRLSTLALLNAVAAPLITFLALPWSLALGLVLALLAVVLGIRARRASAAIRRSEARGVVAIVIGSAGLGLVAVVAAIFAIFWNQISDYRDCLAGANTRVAEEVCSENLTDDLLRLGG